MKRILCSLLSAIILMFFLVGCSNSEEKNDLQNEASTVVEPDNQTYKPDNQTYDPNNELGLTEAEWRFITAGTSGVAEKRQALQDLAESVVGKANVENVAADDSTVKFLLTEPHPADALLIQYTILYRMKDDYNMTVKFVFYEEYGNVQTAYLRSTFNADTLASLDWDEVSILNIKEYAEKYNEF